MAGFIIRRIAPRRFDRRSMTRLASTVLISLMAAGGATFAQAPESVSPPATELAPPNTTPAEETPAELKVKAVVSVAPLKGLVEALLPPGSTVDLLIPPGVSEHGYEIPPRKLQLLSAADVAVMVGLGLEPQVEKFLEIHPNESRRVIEFAGAVGVEAEQDHTHHNHAPGEECTHAVDPHLWLDPQMVQTFVDEVAKQLEAEIRERSPGNGRALAALQERHAALKQRISAVDAAYTSTIGGAKQKTIVVAHDAYGWLAKRYGLRVVPLAGLTAQEPKPSAIAAAINAVKKEGVPVVFAEPQLPKGPMQRVATQTGAKLGMIDPLGDGDWFKLMESNLAAIAEALQAARP